MTKNETPFEAIEQIEILKWARLNFKQCSELRLLNASLSGVRLTPGLRVKMKKQGMVKGYPDLFLPVKTKEYSGLYIELKRRKGGTVSLEQKWWLGKLTKQGFRCEVAKGSDAAISIITDYLWTTLPEGEEEALVFYHH